ncbi:MAG: hypothetical protein ACRDUX_05305 [Mycobacterium sp.]
MKDFGLLALIAGGLAAAVIALAAPAGADIGHNQWVNSMDGSAMASAPHVDTTVRHR